MQSRHASHAEQLGQTLNMQHSRATLEAMVQAMVMRMLKWPGYVTGISGARMSAQQPNQRLSRQYGRALPQAIVQAQSLICRVVLK